jgi:valyl-tRNA synthetase
MRREGASVDWSREKFTMDEDLSRAVREVFVRLYEEGMIYRGNRIVNWCPTGSDRAFGSRSRKTAAGRKALLPAYPIKNSDRRVTVATTRPETMLGDTRRRCESKRRTLPRARRPDVLLPLPNREIPIVADEYVDPEVWHGAVKVTPAHDPNDYEMGLRHNLPQVS